MSGLGDFALDADRQMIRDAAASYLVEASSSAKVRAAMESATGVDESLWAGIREDMAWCATHIPEEHGGLGLGWVELALILEQTGARLACAPFFSTAALAATALMECGTASARHHWLPAIASGEISASLAFGESGIEWVPQRVTATARRQGDTFILDGDFRHVPDGAVVQLLFLPARLEDGSIAVFSVQSD